MDPFQVLAPNLHVIGYVYSVIALIYGVILAFVVIAAWEEYDEADAAAAHEATAVRNLARITRGWPVADRASVEAALVGYARQAVDVEWPVMPHGDLGPATDTATINEIWQVLDRADAATATKSASYAEAIAQFDVLSEARDERVLLARESLPLSLRLVPAIGAVVVVACTYLFAFDDARLHAVLTATLAGLVALLLLLQYQLQRPFHGIVAIEPTAMELVLVEIATRTGLPSMAS